MTLLKLNSSAGRLRVFIYWPLLVLGILTALCGAFPNTLQHQCGFTQLPSILREVEHGMIEYYRVHGEFPRSDVTITWYQRLVDEDLLSLHDAAWLFRSQPTATLDVDIYGQLPLDPFGNAVIVIFPAGEDADFTIRRNWPIARSVGRNGIDDGGLGDDLDGRSGANLGYWEMRNWKRGAMFGIVCVIPLLFLGRLCVRVRVQRGIPVMLSAVGLASLWSGLLANPHAITTGILHPPHWAAVLQPVGWGALLSGLIIFPLAITAGEWHRALRRRSVKALLDRNICPSCHYDLRMNTTGRCPECGSATGRPRGDDHDA